MNVKHYDDITDIHSPLPGYNAVVRVDFVDSVPDSEESQAETYAVEYLNAHGYNIQPYVMEVEFDWRSPSELWIHFNK